MNRNVVVRFAPSPTGYLHIGGARTAIFNWLLARKTGGRYILRIEDTDTERSTEASIQGILDGLTWLGLDWDEGPYFQSCFTKEHLQAAEKLVATGHAYRCFCTREELDRKRETAGKEQTTYRYDGTCRRLSLAQTKQKEKDGLPYTIRLRVPRAEGAVRFKDEVYGSIEKKYADLEDFVIVRSNGQPLYVLSNAVDDIRDGVTHIIRGQDHLANTPKQILIYRALGRPIPKFAHMSLTLDPDKAKISKRRHGEKVAIHYYRENGFLPWAMVNFLVLLGWSASGSKEIYSKDALIEAFSLDGINRANSVFDLRQDDPKFFTDPKALSINAHYLKTLGIDEIIPLVKAQLQLAGIWDDAFNNEKKEWFGKTVDLIRERCQVTTDFATIGRAFFSEEYEIDEALLEKQVLRHEMLKHWLPVLADRIETMASYTPEAIEGVLRALLKESEIKTGVLINGVRVAVTGQAVGPDFIKTLHAIGQRAVARRLRSSAERFS